MKSWFSDKFIFNVNVSDDGGGGSGSTYVPSPLPTPEPLPPAPILPVYTPPPIISEQPISFQVPNTPQQPLNYDYIVAQDSNYSPIQQQTLNPPVVTPVTTYTPPQPQNIDYSKVVPTPISYIPTLQSPATTNTSPTIQQVYTPPAPSISYTSYVPEPVDYNVIGAGGSLSYSQGSFVPTYSTPSPSTYLPEITTPTTTQSYNYDAIVANDSTYSPISYMPTIESTPRAFDASSANVQSTYTPTPSIDYDYIVAQDSTFSPVAIYQPSADDIISVLGQSSPGGIAGTGAGLYQPKLTPEFLQAEKDLIDARTNQYNATLDNYNKSVSDYEASLASLNIPALNKDVDAFTTKWANKIDSNNNFIGTASEWDQYKQEFTNIKEQASKSSLGFADLSTPSFPEFLRLKTEQGDISTWIDKLNSDVTKFNTENMTPTASGMYPPGFIGPPIPGAERFDISKTGPMTLDAFVNLYMQDKGINPVDPMLRQSDFIKPGTMIFDPAATAGREAQEIAHEEWAQAQRDASDLYRQQRGTGTFAQSVGSNLVSSIGFPAIGKAFEPGGGLHAITIPDWITTGVSGAFAGYSGYSLGKYFTSGGASAVTPKITSVEPAVYEPSFGETFGTTPGQSTFGIKGIPGAEGVKPVPLTVDELAALDRYAVPDVVSASISKPDPMKLFTTPQTQTYVTEPLSSKAFYPPSEEEFGSLFGVTPGINVPRPPTILEPVTGSGKYPTSIPSKIAPNDMNLGPYPDYNAAGMPEVWNPAGGMTKIELGEQPLAPVNKPYSGWDDFAKPETYNPQIEAPDFSIRPPVETPPVLPTPKAITGEPVLGVTGKPIDISKLSFVPDDSLGFGGSVTPPKLKPMPTEEYRPGEPQRQTSPESGTSTRTKVAVEERPAEQKLSDVEPQTTTRTETRTSEDFTKSDFDEEGWSDARMTPEQAAKYRTEYENGTIPVYYPRYRVDTQGNIIPTETNYPGFMPNTITSPYYNPIPSVIPEVSPIIDPYTFPSITPKTIPEISPITYPEFSPRTGTEVAPVHAPDYIPNPTPYINPYPGTTTLPNTYTPPNTFPVTTVIDFRPTPNPVTTTDPTPGRVITPPEPKVPDSGIIPKLPDPTIIPPPPKPPDPSVFKIPPFIPTPGAPGMGDSRGTGGIVRSKRKIKQYFTMPNLVVYMPTWDFDKDTKPMSVLNREETIVTPKQKLSAGAKEELGQGYYRGHRTLSFDNGRII